MYEWDEAKRRANLARHGVDFADLVRFEWAAHEVEADDRVDYGESRWRARGLIDGRLHVVVYTQRQGRLRIISLRKANRREIAGWMARRKSG